MHGAKKTDLVTLLSKSDTVTIHTPLLKKTKNLVGAKEFSIMKPGCVLERKAPKSQTTLTR